MAGAKKTGKTYNTPGVYIEEVSYIPPLISQVATGITAFIGYTEKIKDTGTAMTPVRIRSLTEYEQHFGKAYTGKSRRYFLYYSIMLFFANGGKDCYILSAGNYSDAVAYGNEHTGMYAALNLLATFTTPDLIAFPDAVSLPPADLYRLQRDALAQCAASESRFCIFDLPSASAPTLHQQAENFRKNIGTSNLEHGAVYTPWLTILAGKLNINIPPSGAVAGIYARTDNTQGIWKAPANMPIAGIAGPVLAINDRAQQGLNIHTHSGVSINAIRPFTGKGTLVWGARTMAGNDNEWRYISVRRLFNMVRTSVHGSTAWVTFEQNNTALWAKARLQIENYLNGLWRNGALQGNKAELAYYVAIGLNRSMTKVDIQEGRVIIEIGIAAVRPAEFIIIKIVHRIHK